LIDNRGLSVGIGKHGVLTPTEARRKAKQELGKVANGVDVAQEKREAREKLTGQTLRNLISRPKIGGAEARAKEACTRPKGRAGAALA
jgi:hypothetical protein